MSVGGGGGGGGGSAPAMFAKCRAMYSRLLGRSDYDALLRRASVPRIAEYLKKETHYAHALRRLNEHDAHRGQLERALKQSLFYDYEKLLSFSCGGCKEAIRALFEAHEVNDLKLVISSICSDHEQLLAAGDLDYARRYSSFGADALLSPTSIQGLAENLKGTRYYDVLQPFAASERPDFLLIDRALDMLTHRSKLEALRKHMSGAARATCLDAYGQEVDIANIQFIYRMKKLFRYPPQTVVACLVPHHHRIDSQALVEMAECESMEALSGLAARTRYKELFPPGGESTWETIQAEHFCGLHHRNLRNPGAGGSAALSYLHLKETDIRNIIVIVEGVRYALPTKQINSLLVCGRAA